MKQAFLLQLIALIPIVGLASGHGRPDSSAVKLFPLQNVRLLDGPFRHAQELNKKYLLELDADRLLAPFLREAGLTPKIESYGNWENSGLDGHIGGHYLTALSLMYAATDDQEVKAKLDYFLNELKRCQDQIGNGYIGGVPGGAELWENVRKGNIHAGGFDLNKKWVPLYNIHKTYAGLRDAYLIGGQLRAKEMLIKMTEWSIQLVDNLSDEQLQDMLRSEHGGLNEVFADVAEITGDERYLRLAKQFSHRAILQPLLAHEDKLTGFHANTQIPKVIGFKRIADITHDSSWNEAARFFWESVVYRRSVSIGGNSAHEHFHPTTDFSRMIRAVEGPETCNTYNMLKLTEQLFCTEPDVRYVDYYERALYNHILSTQHPETGGFVYFTPMRPGHYRVYSQPHTSFWCCVGSGLENHSKYGEFIYAHRSEELFVNLFLASKLTWNARGVNVVQQTDFPLKPTTTLTMEMAEPTEFTLQVRYPGWVRDNELNVTVNGSLIDVDAVPGSYIRINREWHSGDQVQVTFAMRTAVEQPPDSSNYYSFLYGPIVLAAKTDTVGMIGLFADDSRGGHIAHGPQLPLRDAPIVVADRAELAALPRPIAGKRLHFSLDNLYAEKQKKSAELMPFYQLHESRYIIYWPQATEEEVVELQREIAANEQESARLEAVTVDGVSAGQQQPESDHAIQFEQSTTGQYEGTQWRAAKGWFSYELRNPDLAARYLFLRYFDMDRPSDFEVTVNGQPLASVSLDGKADGIGLKHEVFALSVGMADVDNLTVRIVARESGQTAKITEIRLLSASLEE